MSPAPLGYEHRDDNSPRGWLARWWLRRRTNKVAAALDRIKKSDEA